MRQSDYLIQSPLTGRQPHVLVCCHFPLWSRSHVTDLLQGSVRWELEVMMALLTHLFSVSYPSIYPPPSPHPNCTHLLVLAPLRPKCDLCPDKGRWKRDCQTGRVGSEPLRGISAILSWRGQWMAFSHVKKGQESVWVALVSTPLPTPGDSRRHGVTAVSGMLGGHWATFPSPSLRLCVRILPVLSTVGN